MVTGADLAVIDIEKDPAAASICHRGEELPFRDCGILELHVTGHVLNQDLAAQEILYFVNPLSHVVERFVRRRKRKKVVQVIAADCTPAQMLRDEAWIEAVYELAELCQMFSSKRPCGTDR